MLWRPSHSLSLACSSPHHAGTSTSLFQMHSPRLSHSQPWRGELILLHTEPSPASSHHLPGGVNGTAFLLSRNEEMEGGHGNEERQRQVFMLAGSREGGVTHRHLQGRGSPRRVLLLGSARRHLPCSPVFWEGAFRQYLGSKCAGVLCGGFSALHKGQQ